ncbi:hypothetical protein B296_00023636 [Ensete ventricosum]|uniref:Uncharacterized protein n=1 Tax=Ensete ventricosum TaxID=4639 RepID=A0A426YMX5_ENSVE|nr:hypothetical protein B296_00023636 [Ensete ventricosum]
MIRSYWELHFDEQHKRQEEPWIQGVNVIVPQRWVFRVSISNLTSDESLGHQHIGVVYHRGRSQINCLEKTEVLKQVVERGEEATMNPEGLSYPKAECRLERRWTRRSATVPQRRTYRLRRKGCRCKSTDSRAMGSTAPWYRRGGTSVESSIPCSYGGRALVVKGAEEVKNAEANSKYQDKAEGQRLWNFIRPVSTSFSSK